MTDSETDTEKHAGGRPTDYKPEYAKQAEKLCKLLNATDIKLADYFGVCEATIYNWKKAHPEFLEAIRRGKTPADAEVANSLHQRAMGYEYEEAVPIKRKIVTYGDNGKKTGEEEVIETVMVTRVIPPDTAACVHWLNNRQPTDWKNKQEISGDMKHSHEVTRLTDDELDNELNRLEQAAEGATASTATGEGTAN